MSFALLGDYASLQHSFLLSYLIATASAMMSICRIGEAVTIPNSVILSSLTINFELLAFHEKSRNLKILHKHDQKKMGLKRD
jgi:hypothetical protein